MFKTPKTNEILDRLIRDRYKFIADFAKDPHVQREIGLGYRALHARLLNSHYSNVTYIFNAIEIKIMADILIRSGFVHNNEKEDLRWQKLVELHAKEYLMPGKKRPLAERITDIMDYSGMRLSNELAPYFKASTVFIACWRSGEKLNALEALGLETFAAGLGINKDSKVAYKFCEDIFTDLKALNLKPAHGKRKETLTTNENAWVENLRHRQEHKWIVDALGL